MTFKQVVVSSSFTQGIDLSLPPSNFVTWDLFPTFFNMCDILF